MFYNNNEWFDPATSINIILAQLAILRENVEHSQVRQENLCTQLDKLQESFEESESNNRMLLRLVSALDREVKELKVANLILVGHNKELRKENVER